MPAISFSEFQILRKEVESMSESFGTERLERKTETDQLSIELEALKRTLGRLFPEFDAQYRKAYDEAIQAFNPERRTA